MKEQTNDYAGREKKQHVTCHPFEDDRSSVLNNLFVKLDDDKMHFCDVCQKLVQPLLSN